MKKALLLCLLTQFHCSSGSSLNVFGITGTITPALADVQVSLSGDANRSVKSTADGKFAFFNLGNGSYTIRPTFAGTVFTPLSRQVSINGTDVIGINFEAASTTGHSLSGAVSGDVRGGVTIKFNGTQTQVTDAQGVYQFSNLADGEYTIVPSLSGYVFEPTSRQGTLAGTDLNGLNFVATQIEVTDGPTIGPCPVFPKDNPWNTSIENAPVHPNSDAIIANMQPQKGIHLDFGDPWDGDLNGIPFNVVGADQTKVNITYTGPELAESYPDESDCGPMPIPVNATVENAPEWGAQNGGSDRHVLVVDIDSCLLYELYLAYKNVDNSWYCAGSAIFDLTKNTLRPIGWTSADAAGLPIFPGLVRWDEVEKALQTNGDLGHALRFTMVVSRKAFMLPATHFASSDLSANTPPMGMRFRLKASFDISSFSAKNKVLLRTLKKYGMFMADNGGDWFISGVPNNKPCDPGHTGCQAPSGGFSADDHNQIKDNVSGRDFEVVDTGKIYVDWAGVSQAENEVTALQPINCSPPKQTGLECVCYE